MGANRFIPLTTYREYPPEEMRRRAEEFRADLERRRTVRQFSDQPVAREVIEECLRAAGTAPSGAHMQPWHFAVTGDPALKHRIREAAEREERDFYQHRAPPEWLEALAPLGTDEHKGYLEVAPWLVAIFARTYGVRPDGTHVKHYYVQESVGIATGMLITALHHAGCVTLTHTPSPMGFLLELVGRPENERAFLLLVVGHPSADATVPGIRRRSLAEIASFR